MPNHAPTAQRGTVEDANMLMHGGSAWGGAEAPYLSSETDSQEDEMLQVDEVWDSDEGEDGGSDQGEEAKGGVEEGQDADGVGTEIFGAKTGRGSGGGGVGGEASAEEIGERSDRSRRVPREVPAPKNAPPANAQVGVHEKAARRPRDEEGPSLAGLSYTLHPTALLPEQPTLLVLRTRRAKGRRVHPKPQPMNPEP